MDYIGFYCDLWESISEGENALNLLSFITGEQDTPEESEIVSVKETR